MNETALSGPTTSNLAQKAVSASPVQSLLNQVDEKLLMIASNLDKLQDRIAPVLSPVPPSDNKGGPAPDAPISDISLTLHRQLMGLEMINNHAVDIIARVEV